MREKDDEELGWAMALIKNSAEIETGGQLLQGRHQQ